MCAGVHGHNEVATNTVARPVAERTFGQPASMPKSRQRSESVRSLQRFRQCPERREDVRALACAGRLRRTVRDANWSAGHRFLHHERRNWKACGIGLAKHRTRALQLIRGEVDRRLHMTRAVDEPQIIVDQAQSRIVRKIVVVEGRSIGKSRRRRNAQEQRKQRVPPAAVGSILQDGVRLPAIRSKMFAKVSHRLPQANQRSHRIGRVDEGVDVRIMPERGVAQGCATRR